MIDSQLDRLALDSWPIDSSSSSGPLSLAVDLTAHMMARRPLVPIKGARKVWNTYKFVTASAVSHAIHKITSIPAADLSIKRKFKSNDNKVLSWWFVVRGEETILEQLDNL